jgi:hypothetical protein
MLTAIAVNNDDFISIQPYKCTQKCSESTQASHSFTEACKLEADAQTKTLKELKTILNRIAPSNFTKLSQEILDLDVNSFDTLTKVWRAEVTCRFQGVIL